ncbi:MAG: DoxX family protein [Cyanobacteria bacterium P01_G01_bin.19]
MITSLFRSNFSGGFSFQAVWLVVRIMASILMIHNGLDKLADISGFADNVVVAIGLPYPIFFSYCAAYIEIIGAIFLALGFLTRPSAIALFSTMLIAIYFHIKVDGLVIRPSETASLYALLYFLFAINGSGTISVDNWLAKLLSKRSQ